MSMAFTTPDYMYNPDSMILDHPEQISGHLCPEVRKGLAVAGIRMDAQGEFSMTPEQVLAMCNSIQESVGSMCTEYGKMLFLADHERGEAQQKVEGLIQQLNLQGVENDIAM